MWEMGVLGLYRNITYLVTTSLIYITQSNTGKTIMHTKWGPNENYHSRFSYTCILGGHLTVLMYKISRTRLKENCST